MPSIGDVFLRLLLDDSDFEKQVVARAEKAGAKAGLSLGSQMAAGLSKGATNIGKTLAGVGKDLTQTGTTMTRNLTLPILAAGGAVTKFALDFDTTMRQVVGLTDVTAGEIDGIKEKILALAPAVGKGPQELAEAFYFVASAGFKADEALQVLEVSAKAAAAGLGDTQTIAQVLGGVINAYGKENMTAARAADILTEAVSQGTAEASGLASVIGNVVPGAAALGVSFDQVTAAMAGMTLSGVGVEESATSLIQIFSSLQKPTSQAEDALNGLGTSSAELRRQLREEGLLATLRTLEERFAGNEVAAAAVFGNIRALRGVTALLGLDTEQLNTVFEKVNDSTGRMGSAFATVAEGPGFQIKAAMADLEVTAIQLGTDVLPLVVDVLGKVAAGARELGKWWKSLDAGTREQIVQWLAWVAIAGPALLLLGKLASGLGAIFKVVGFLAGAKGIPRLVVALKGLRLASFGALGPLGLLILAVVTLYELLDGSDEAKAFELTAKKLGLSIDEVKARVATFAEATGASFDDAIAAVSAGTDAFDAAAVTFFRPFLSGFDEAREAARLKAEGIPTDTVAALVDGQYVIGPAAEVMVDPIAEALQKAVEDAGKKAQDMLDALAGTLAEGPQQLKDELKAIADALLHPYTDFRRRVDLEANLASKVVLDGLRSQDSKIQADTAKKVEGWLAEYELLAPGAFAAGQLVNPSLKAGIDTNLAAMLTFLHDDAIIPLTDLFDVADVLEAQGQTGLAAWARGAAAAKFNLVDPLVNQMRNDLHAKLGDTSGAYDGGYSITNTWGNGLVAGVAAARAKMIVAVTGIRNLMGHSLPTEGPLQHPEIGGLSIGEAFMHKGLVASIRAAIPTLVRTIAGVGQSMAFAPSLGALGVPSISGMAAVAGSAIQSVEGISNKVGMGSAASGNTFGNININAPTVPMTARDIGRELRRTGVFGGTP